MSTLAVLKQLRWVFFTARAAAAEVVGQSLRIVKRLLHLKGAPRPGDTFVCKRWLGATLRAAGIIPAHVRVSSVTPMGLDGNRGFIGVMSRLCVTYEPAWPSAPSTFIMKMSRPG